MKSTNTNTTSPLTAIQNAIDRFVSGQIRAQEMDDIIQNAYSTFSVHDQLALSRFASNYFLKAANSMQ